MSDNADEAPAGFRFVGAAALGSGLAFVLTYVVFVLTTFGQRVDNAGMADLANMDWHFLSDVDEKVLMALGAVIVAVISVLRRRLVLGAVVLAGYVAALGGTWILYRLLVRPETAAVDRFATENSFPSGHLVTVMVIFLAVTLVLPRLGRVVWMLPGAALVAVYAAGVLELGWHRYSDVIGGCLLAMAVLFATAAVLAWRQQPAGTESRGPALAAFAAPLVFVAAAIAVAGLMDTANSLLAAISGVLAVGFGYVVLSRTGTD